MSWKINCYLVHSFISGVARDIPWKIFNDFTSDSDCVLEPCCEELKYKCAIVTLFSLDMSTHLNTLISKVKYNLVNNVGNMSHLDILSYTDNFAVIRLK